jgi:hypothetical protein
MRQGTTFALVPLYLGIVLSPAFAGPWSLPDESRGVRVAPLLLLSRPDIRDDLQLPAALAPEVEKAIGDLFEKAAALKGKTGEAAVAGRRLVDEGQKAWLEAHLTPDQVDRLSQIDLRWEGPAALATRPSVAGALALSDEQRAALNRAVLERNAHRDRTRDALAAEHHLAVRAQSILSDGQKKRWEQMLGRPIAAKAAPGPATASNRPTGR